MENDTTQVGLDFYRGPGLSVDLEYDRYLHRQGHDPLGGPVRPTVSRRRWASNPPLPNNTPGYVMYGQDLNVGQDYAIRVQELKTDFRGNLSENLKWG